MHESAGLVHANLTPDAVLVNAKGDWKISGLAFAGPHESSTAATSLTAISLSEVLNHDPRLPRNVQLNLDYTSPDFVLDNNLTASADIFSLGLLIIALYNSPHTSPLRTNESLSAYKRLFASSSSIPTQNNNFLVPSSHPLPPKLSSELLPRLITRRPAQRMAAKEFQQAAYFDNILVSTIRFLDALPAKTPNEKLQFLRGLPRIMPQFPKSVLEKKVLPALLEEMKDKDLLAPILTNVFAMIKVLPTGKRAFTEQIVPKLANVFSTVYTNLPNGERSTTLEPGLMVLLENMSLVAENCPGKDFGEAILPIILQALKSPTHTMVDVALRTLPHCLSALDFSTIKNDLFPVIANVFAQTSSLNIKIRGLEAFYTLIGGSSTSNGNDDDMSGFATKPTSSVSSSAILDKFTIQEKIVPLMKGIKTKEPGVMMAALQVFRRVGEVADSDFLAMEVLPTLWMMALGPLLNLAQFQEFMTLIKGLGSRIEREQTKKLREMGATGSATAGSVGPGRQQSVAAGLNGMDAGETDFETLVSGKNHSNAHGGDLMNDWAVPATAVATRPAQGTRTQSAEQPMFSWQSATSQPQQPATSTLKASGQPFSRAVTPDTSLSSFATLAPQSTQFSQPLQPRPMQQQQQQAAPFSPTPTTSSFGNAGAGSAINWSAARQQRSFQPPTQPTQPLTNGSGASSPTMNGGMNSFTLSPPPTSPQAVGQFTVPFKPGIQKQQTQPQGQSQRQGLDKYESLL